MFFTVTCQPLVLGGQPRALKTQILTYFILKEKTKKLPLDFFSGHDDVIKNSNPWLPPFVMFKPKRVQTQTFYVFLIKTTRLSTFWRVWIALETGELWLNTWEPNWDLRVNQNGIFQQLWATKMLTRWFEGQFSFCLEKFHHSKHAITTCSFCQNETCSCILLTLALNKLVVACNCSHIHAELTPSVLCEFCAIIQLVQDGFWVVVIQQLDSKLSNSWSTCLTDLKFSSKMHFHKNFCLKLGCKRPKLIKVIVFYSTTAEPALACCQARAATVSPMCWEQSPVAQLKN